MNWEAMPLESVLCSAFGFPVIKAIFRVRLLQMGEFLVIYEQTRWQSYICSFSLKTKH